MAQVVFVHIPVKTEWTNYGFPFCSTRGSEVGISWQGERIEGIDTIAGLVGAGFVMVDACHSEPVKHGSSDAFTKWRIQMWVLHSKEDEVGHP
jgi:hypothetical protein